MMEYESYKQFSNFEFIENHFPVSKLLTYGIIATLIQTSFKAKIWWIPLGPAYNG